MSTSRLLSLIFGISVILGLIIWLISSLSWLYSQVAWTAPPLLANLLLLLLILLIGMIIAAFGYYVNLYLQPKGARKRGGKKIKIPAMKVDAAAENLRAVKKQVSQIQDKVTQRALINKSREIEANLARGNIKVVVFGMGSAGKTSVINALIGRMVGEVAAPMGSTKTGQVYDLQLAGLDRDILLTDTPGILEAGLDGKDRENLARSLATDANLLLFVIDNDLNKSEYRSLVTLWEIGKRLIVVLNKSDLYPEADQQEILEKLRERLHGMVHSLDVVSISANPQQVRLASGEIFTPQPDIMPLIRRIAAVLRAEGEDLVADNILLQSQRLGEQARQLIDNQRRRQAEKVVDQYQWIGAGVIAVTPLPVVDLLATAAVNAQMVMEIGKIYGCEINIERGRELALSLAKTLASLGIVEGVIKLVTTALQLNLATFLVGKAIQGVTAAYLTRIAGKSFIEYFRHNQDWGDGGITEVVQRQFQLTRKDEFVKSFIQDAIAKVVEPLQRERFDQEYDDYDDYDRYDDQYYSEDDRYDQRGSYDDYDNYDNYDDDYYEDDQVIHNYRQRSPERPKYRYQENDWESQDHRLDQREW